MLSIFETTIIRKQMSIQSQPVVDDIKISDDDINELLGRFGVDSFIDLSIEDKKEFLNTLKSEYGIDISDLPAEFDDYDDDDDDDDDNNSSG